MKYLPIVVCVLVIFCLRVNAQPDLTVTAFGFNLDEVNKGGYVLASAYVQNIGNSTAYQTKASFHLYQGNSLNDSNLQGFVSVHQLEPFETDTIFFLMTVPHNISSDIYRIGIWVDRFSEELESDENNNAFTGQGPSSEFINVLTGSDVFLKSPYPIIFLHGLGSNDNIWNTAISHYEEKYGYVDGGSLHYCLNPDGNVFTSDAGSYFSESDFVNTIRRGDIYTVNFDISSGFIRYPSDQSDVQSNQSAIVKQGWAVREAVRRVLETTGKDKVILVGHSMGGLAAREYIQNQDKWQDDGQHHIAKVHTLDSPHSGSNNIPLLVDVFTDNDSSSEAIRDLAFDSWPSVGTYIDGGSELLLDPNSYYNRDVNCNGVLDIVVGINQKSTPRNISYSCSIATGLDLFIYDVVSDASANLNNYLFATPPLQSPVAPIYYVSEDHRSIHQNIQGVLQGLDQQVDIPYEISIGELYSEFSTPHANILVNNDSDSYFFTIDELGTLQIGLIGMSSPNSGMYLFDENEELIATSNFDAEDYKEIVTEIPSGIYYLVVSSVPERLISGDTILYSPYYITSVHTPFVPIVANFESDTQAGCSPLTVKYLDSSSGTDNSYLWSFEGGTPSISNEKDPIISYTESGVYSTTLVVFDTFQSDTIIFEDYIEILELPSPDFTIDLIGENGINVTVLNPEQQVSYIWEFSSQISTTGINAFHEYADSGTYTVTLSATNECGTRSINKEVVILPFDMPISVTINSNINEGCIPFEVNFDADVTSGIADIFYWEFPNGNPSTSLEKNPIVSYSSKGEFHVYLRSSNTTYSDEMTYPEYIFASDTPTTDFSIENNSEFEVTLSINDPEQENVYQWNLGDGNTLEGSIINHTYAAPGVYIASVTTENQCGESFSEQLIEIDGSSSISDLEGKVQIFPNPSNGLITLELPGYADLINIYSYEGNSLVCNSIVEKGNNRMELDCTNLMSGLYLLKLHLEETEYYQSIIIVKDQ